MINIIKKYLFGFSWESLVAFLLVMAPNILWMVCPPVNDPLARTGAPAAVEFAMSASQLLMIALLVVIKRKDAAREKLTSRIFCIACGALLLSYYLLWAAYFLGYAAPLQLLGMAVFPCTYFILFAVWRKNMLALVPVLVFAVLHIGVTVINFVK